MGSSSGSGGHPEGQAAGSHARPWAPGAVCVETERGPETGPFKSLSPSARPPTPNHSIQDSWAEPAGLLGPGGGVGAQSKGGLHTLKAASQHFPPPTQQHWGAGLAGHAVPKKPGGRYSPVHHRPQMSQGPGRLLPPPTCPASPSELEEQAQAAGRGEGAGLWPWPPAGSSGGTTGQPQSP